MRHPSPSHTLFISPPEHKGGFRRALMCATAVCSELSAHKLCVPHTRPHTPEPIALGANACVPLLQLQYCISRGSMSAPEASAIEWSRQAPFFRPQLSFPFHLDSTCRKDGQKTDFYCLAARSHNQWLLSTRHWMTLRCVCTAQSICTCEQTTDQQCHTLRSRSDFSTQQWHTWVPV